MSIFTNSYTAAAKEAEQYIQAVLELVGDREPLAVLEELPGEVRRLIEGNSREQLRTPEKPGKWSMVEVLQHLVDSELVWAWRLRLIIAQDRPQLTGYDQDAWARELRYADTESGTALQELEVLRASNLRLLHSLRPDQLERVGVHTERGEESVRHLIRLYAGHDLLHRKQLERIGAAVSS